MQSHIRHRTTRRTAIRITALGTAVIPLLLACTAIDSRLDAQPQPAHDWSAPTADSRNSSASSQSDLPDLPELVWSRDLGSPLPGPATFDGRDSLWVFSATGRGCNIFALSRENGRKQWCSRTGAGGPRVGAQITSYGDSLWPTVRGATLITGQGETHWNTDFPAFSTTARLLNPQQVLLVSNWGQARVVSSKYGKPHGAVLNLADSPPRVPVDYGLPWCETGTRGCPSPAPAAIAPDGKRFFLTIWAPDRDTPELIAVDVITTSSKDINKEARPDDPNSTVTLREAWRVPLPHGRTGAPPVLTADAKTVYVPSPEGISAHRTDDGTERWYHNTKLATDFAPAVSDSGTLILGGRTATFYRGEGDSGATARKAASHGGGAIALRDAGDHAEELWRDETLASLSAPIMTRDGASVFATQGRENSVWLRALDEHGHEVWAVPVPDARGPVGGLSLNKDGEFALSLAVGRLYLYRAN